MKKFVMFSVLLMLSVLGNAQLSSDSRPEVFRGVIYDLRTSRPLEGAEVRIQTLGGEIHTMTDESGYFSLSGVSKSPFRLIISMTGYQDKVLEQVSRLDEVEYYIGLEQRGVKHPGSGL